MVDLSRRQLLATAGFGFASEADRAKMRGLNAMKLFGFPT